MDIHTQITKIRTLLGNGDAEAALAAARQVSNAALAHEASEQTTLDEIHHQPAWKAICDAVTVPVQVAGDTVRADVVNDIFTVTERDYADKVFLIQIADGISTHFYLAAAATAEEALDAYADNNETCKLTLVGDDDALHPDDCMALGNADELHFFESLLIEEVKAAGPVYVKSADFPAIKATRDKAVGVMPMLDGWEAADRPREEMIRPTKNSEIFVSLMRDWSGHWAALLVNWDGVPIKPTQKTGQYGTTTIATVITRDWMILPDDLEWTSLEEALDRAGALAVLQ